MIPDNFYIRFRFRLKNKLIYEKKQYIEIDTLFPNKVLKVIAISDQMGDECEKNAIQKNLRTVNYPDLDSADNTSSKIN